MSTPENPNTAPNQASDNTDIQPRKRNYRLLGCSLAAVAAFGIYCAKTKIEANQQKVQANTEYVKKFDRQNFYLSTINSEGFEQLPGAISDESFAQIPEYKAGDDLTSPRVYHFKLEAETCKTFKLDDVARKGIRVAKKSSAPYPYTSDPRISDFGIVTNMEGFSLCQINPTPRTTPDGKTAPPYVDLAIQATIPGSKLNRDW